MSAGINVALGTDSILCLATPDRLSVLDDMRFLFQRDLTDPAMLLRMGTTHGARALGFDPALVTLAPGPTAGLIAISIDASSSVDPLEQIMTNTEAPKWVVGPTAGDNSWWTGHANQ